MGVLYRFSGQGEITHCDPGLVLADTYARHAFASQDMPVNVEWLRPDCTSCSMIRMRGFFEPGDLVHPLRLSLLGIWTLEQDMHDMRAKVQMPSSINGPKA